MNKFLFPILALSVALFIFVGAPSEEDIKACQEQTVWKYERCLQELSR